MRVLVTGGSGFIGSAVQAELRRRELEPVVLDLPWDVNDPRDVDEAVRVVDAVIHLAGRLGTAETFGDERAVAQTNILGALNVADACARRDIPMVQIGTGHKGQANPYAITKACAEDLFIGRAQVTGQRINVVRAFHAYGPGQKACAPHGSSPVRKIIPSFVCRALDGLSIEINGSGEQLIDLVHVDEVARVLVDALEGPWGEVLEAGTGHAITVNQAAGIVAKRCASDSAIVHVPMRAGEPELSAVVAIDPLCEHAFPWRLDEVIEYYAEVVARARA